MKNLINITNQNGSLVVSSREIAVNFDKEHRGVLRDLDNLKEGLAQNWADLFYETTYIHPQNKQEYREVLMNRDGFTLLAMGFTGQKALEWKLKYIEAFNKMEQGLKQFPALSKELQAIFAIDQRTLEIDNRITELEDNMPLFNVECKELQALVRKVATRVLGGYRSPAYCDNSLRGKVYSDIQNQLKREFGVERYEAIKRSQLGQAKEILSSYKAPLILVQEIQLENRQIAI